MHGTRGIFRAVDREQHADHGRLVVNGYFCGGECALEAFSGCAGRLLSAPDAGVAAGDGALTVLPFVFSFAT